LNILEEVQALIEKYQPDLILTHSENDTHQEHRELNEITIGAARRCRASILCYGTLSNTLNFHPHLFCDISEVFEKKLTSLRAHKSQKDKFYMQPEYLQTFHARNYPSLHGIPICEAYEIVRIFD
jgi:LmbE family N-acetylglucosaminyl deacetylase